MERINHRIQLTGERLKHYIKVKGFTQDEFALEKMFVDPSTLRRWISNGITKLSVLIELSIALDIETEKLLK